MIPQWAESYFSNELKVMAPLPVDDVPVRLCRFDGIKAVLVDLFGTLLVSGTGDGDISGIHDNHYPVAPILDKLGCEVLFDRFDDRITEILYRTIKEMRHNNSPCREIEIRSVWKETLDHLIADRLIAWKYNDSDIEKLSVYYDMTINPVWPMPGAKDFLVNLVKKDYHIGSVVNGAFYVPWIIEFFFGTRDPDGLFESALFYLSSQTGLLKPSRELYAQIAQRAKKELNLDPEQILVVGNDYVNDIAPASDQGFRTAVFCGDSRSFHRNISDSGDMFPKADCIIKEFETLNQSLNV